MLQSPTETREECRADMGKLPSFRVSICTFRCCRSDAISDVLRDVRASWKLSLRIMGSTDTKTPTELLLSDSIPNQHLDLSAMMAI